MLLCENVVFDISWAKDIYKFFVTHQPRVYQHSKVSIRYPCIEKLIFLDKLVRSRYPIIYPILG